MTIERVTPATASLASHIYAYSWQAGYRGIVPQAYLDTLSPERWTSKLGRGTHDDYLLRDGDAFVATSSITPARDEAMTGWGEVMSLYVLPAYFRCGCGRTLLAYDLEQLQVKGFHSVYLWVLEKNARARSFYASMGFAPNGDQSLLTIGGQELVECRYVWHAEKR